MVEVYPNLFVGDDTDHLRAKAKGYAIVSACKEGPFGHRALLKYDTLGAPKNKFYLAAKHGKNLVLNLIDSDDPDFIPKDLVTIAFNFIDDRLKSGDKVLIHCNHGHSRGPTLAMMYMRRIGDLPERFRSAFNIFKTLYPKYDPAQGMLQFAKNNWSSLKKD